MGFDLASGFHVFFIAMLSMAAITDFCSFRIFNSNVLALLAGFCVFALYLLWPIMMSDIAVLGWHLAAAAIALVVFFVFFALGQMGAGDVKLIAAIVLWFGFHPVSVHFVLYSTIAGGLLTILLWIWRKYPLPKPLQNYSILKRLHVRRLHTPYGITLGGVGIWCSFYAPIFSVQ